MARIGLSKPYYALYAASDGTVTYSDGGLIAKAVETDISPDDSGAVKFYADNGIAESANIFNQGTLTLSIDHLSAAVAAALLGLTVDSVTTPAGSMIKYLAGAVAPYVGVGLIVKSIVSGSAQYMAIVLRKCQFNQPGIAQATQGETIEFTAPELTATIMRDDQDDSLSEWKREGYFTTEANAEAWIKAQLSITDSAPVVTDADPVET